MTAVDALLDRAGELKGELLAFSQQPPYDRAFREMLAEHGDDAEVWDESRLILLWDSFVLEYRLRKTGATLRTHVAPELPPLVATPHGVELILINLILSFVLSNISIGGHIGGLIGGTVAALLLFDLRDRVRALPAIVPTALCVALAVAAVVGAIAVSHSGAGV